MKKGYVRIAASLPHPDEQLKAILEAEPTIDDKDIIVEPENPYRRTTKFEEDYPQLFEMVTTLVSNGDTIYVARWGSLGETDGDVDRSIAAFNSKECSVFVCEADMLCKLDTENAKHLYQINEAAKKSLWAAKSKRLIQKRGKLGGRPRAFDSLSKANQTKLIKAWQDSDTTGEQVRALLIKLLPKDSNVKAPSVKNMRRWPELGPKQEAEKAGTGEPLGANTKQYGRHARVVAERKQAKDET